MEKRLLKTGAFVMAVTAGLVAVACGDDDTDVNPSNNTTPDASPNNDSGNNNNNNNDSGTGPNDSGANDSSTPTPSAPITPLTTTRIPNAINPYGLVFGSDNLLYASGATNDGGARKLAVWRFVNGALDTTFGNGGVVIGPDIAGDETSYGIVEIAPSSFVVHAIAGGKVYLTKLSSTGGGGGPFTFGAAKFIKFGWNEAEMGVAWPAGTPNPTAAGPTMNASWGIALDKSSTPPKIVVFASGSPAKTVDPTQQRVDVDRWVARVNTDDDFTNDPLFNGGSPFTTDIDGKKAGDNARRGIVLADGTIVSAGYTDFGTGQGLHVVLIRLLPNGTVDPAFGFGTSPAQPGIVKANPFLAAGGGAEAYSLAIQASGRYVTTGYGTSHFDVQSKNLDLISLGLKADSLDTAYGRNGAFAVQSEKDNSAGLGTSPFTDRGRDLVLLPDQRVVMAGVYDDYATLYVLDKDGNPDPSVGESGRIEYSYPAAFFRVIASADGKQIAATTQSLNQSADASAPLGSVLMMLKVDN